MIFLIHDGLQFVLIRRLVHRSWNTWLMAWLRCHAHLQVILLLLVGILRRDQPDVFEEYFFVATFYQFLGWW